MRSTAPYNMGFANPDPYSWLASSGEFTAQDVFGPPSSVLELTNSGYPGTTLAESGIRGRGAGGQVHWYQDRGWHSVGWIALGWFLFHQYLKAD